MVCEHAWGGNRFSSLISVSYGSTEFRTPEGTERFGQPPRSALSGRIRRNLFRTLGLGEMHRPMLVKFLGYRVLLGYRMCPGGAIRVTVSVTICRNYG